MDIETLKSQIETVKKDPKYRRSLKLKAELIDLGKRRRSLRKQLAANRKALRQKLPAAHEAGITVIQIARWTGMTRRAVYDVLEQQGRPRSEDQSAEGTTTQGDGDHE